MATKTFSSPNQPEVLKTSEDFIKEVHDLAGDKFPVSIEVANAKIINISYETAWKQGTTVPVETDELDERGNTVINYEENYTDKKLTAAQIKKIDAWVKENLAE